MKKNSEKKLVPVHILLSEKKTRLSRNQIEKKQVVEIKKELIYFSLFKNMKIYIRTSRLFLLKMNLMVIFKKHSGNIEQLVL